MVELLDIAPKRPKTHNFPGFSPEQKYTNLELRFICLRTIKIHSNYLEYFAVKHPCYKKHSRNSHAFEKRRRHHNDDNDDDDGKDAEILTWTPLPFGEHIGETLPQVICCRPDYFLWLARQDWVYGPVADEIKILDRRIRGIKIPKRNPAEWVVERWYDVDKRFVRFSFARSDSDQYWKHRPRSACLDLYEIQPQYRGEWRNFIRDLREHYFGGQNITKERAERFFSDKSNFIDP
jgi:hypothetical protein